MTNNTRVPAQPAGSFPESTNGDAPSQISFHSLGPKANDALESIRRPAHRIIAFVVAAHAIIAVMRFSLWEKPARWTLAFLGAILGAVFWGSFVFVRRSASGRQIAALVLFGFVALHSFGSGNETVAICLFAGTLALLVTYQDPYCFWPGALTALVAYNTSQLLSGPAAAQTSIAALGFPSLAALATTAVCAYCSQTLRKASLATLRKESALLVAHACITRELEQLHATISNRTSPLAGDAVIGFAPPLELADLTSSRITEERYRVVIETAFDAIVIIDADTGVIVDLNQRALEILERPASDVIGQRHPILYPSSKRSRSEKIFEKAAKGESHTFEIELGNRRGEVIPCEVAFSVSHLSQQRLVQGVFRDLTERKKAEAEKGAITSRLQEAQRLESLNVLAGGIAHDFNNILMSILGFAAMGKDRSTENSVLTGYFAKIEGAALRAGALCRQMLAFAGRSQVSIHQGDLNQVVLSFEEPLRTNLPSHIRLEMHLRPDLPAVNFDTAQMGQVVVSMVTNATEAIAGSPGVIQIKTFGSLPEDPARTSGFISPEIPHEFCVVLEISDTGCGMSAEQMRRIFEPFYSTKFLGRGLGLSETLGMIRSHNGAIQVQSKRSEGSSFRLYLPAVPTPLPKEMSRPVPPPVDLKPSARPLALVIDDEPAIRDIVGGMLETAGFDSMSACDGTEALELFSRVSHQVNIVLLDLAMPGIPSSQVMERIRAKRPQEMRVFIMSGYSREIMLERCGRNPPDGFLAKPFSAAQLRAALGLPSPKIT